MRSTKDFIKDGLLLTLTSLLLRSAGVFFSARLSIIAGTSVMGLYTQIMTVYAFAVTAASAGINLGAMRIVSECCGNESYDKIRTAVAVCIRYCIMTGLIVGALTFVFAPFFGIKILGDKRTVSCLRALSIALPFIAVSNAFHGYFNGVKQISKSAFTSIFEQFSRIISTLTALSLCSGSSTETLCLILVICNAASEAVSCFILTFFYFITAKKFPKAERSTSDLKKRFQGITIPIAISSLIRSALTTTEHILIPIGLLSSGLNRETALSEYGIISGLVLPILLYPMALLSSFASITIAELSSRVSSGEQLNSIKHTVSKGLSFALIYGIGCTFIIGSFSNQLANVIYKNPYAGYFIKVMAPLIIFMYLDHISDGMLKGLDQQNYVMKVNIFDAFLSVVFAIVLIPTFGIYGFAASLYLCEIMNCCFSFGKIYLLTKPEIYVLKSLILPCSAALISTHCTYIIQGRFNLVSGILISILIYVMLLKITASLTVFENPRDIFYDNTYAEYKIKASEKALEESSITQT